MIGATEVLKHLRAVVVVKGADYVYPGTGPCHYVVNGKPACIVAYVYDRLGLLDQFTRESGAAAWNLHVDRITLVGRDLLTVAQMVQDGAPIDGIRRGTWGEALAAAETVGGAL